MPLSITLREQAAIGWYLLKWLLLTVPVGIAAGSACALFLWMLGTATATQFRHPELLYFLPVAGLLIGTLYLACGKSVEAGNNLIVDEIHEPGGGVPLRMAPLILVGTVVTHLFGGSAGREGTAVQMGGSLASGFARLLPRLSRDDVRILLMAGISAGFGGVFGTPIAGTVFAMEVLIIGRMNSAGLYPCLIAGIVSDFICTAWGIGHTHYQIESMLTADSMLHLAPLTLPMLSKVALAGIAFGLASLLFSELVHGLQHAFKSTIPWTIARPVAGGVIVIGLVWLVGTRDYLGLGVSSPDPNAVTIVNCFREGGAEHWSWIAKLVFTAVTLASGFKGGEVTPLFFIGAALGHSLAIVFDAPVDLFAALGFLAVFAGATNTPIACTIMGVELFGGEYIVYFATACGIAYLCSGHSGIYLSQRIGLPKAENGRVETGKSLRETREKKRSKSSQSENAPSRTDRDHPENETP